MSDYSVKVRLDADGNWYVRCFNASKFVQCRDLYLYGNFGSAAEAGDAARKHLAKFHGKGLTSEGCK